MKTWFVHESGNQPVGQRKTGKQRGCGVRTELGRKGREKDQLIIYQLGERPKRMGRTTILEKKKNTKRTKVERKGREGTLKGSQKGGDNEMKN